jgi:acyl-CoA dehydrogenase
VDFSIPDDVARKLAELDAFIEREIAPLEREHPQYFDHRREFARTDVENGGRPRREWEALLGEMRRRADAAGHLRYGLPKELGGSEASNLAMAIVREHLAHKGLGLHNDLQNESSIVGNFPSVIMMWRFGTEAQKREFLPGMITGTHRVGFGLTEPGHGSDATWLETTAERDGGDWVINGAKRFNSVVDVAAANIVFARTGGQPGKAAGITAFIVPRDTPGMTVPYYHWCFNMPSDHAETLLEDVRVPDSAVLGEVGDGLGCVQLFVHENRIRQAASSLGAAQFCIDRSIEYAEERVIFGQPLADYQGVQWQLVELQTDAEFLRNTLYKTAWEMDQAGDGASTEAKTVVTDKVSMVNYRGNQLACRAADRAIQIHGGVGYTRHVPFEHIYRHHRRYRITEGSDELQMRGARAKARQKLSAAAAV